MTITDARRRELIAAASSDDRARENWAAEQPDCPPDVLRMLIALPYGSRGVRPPAIVRAYGHPNCPLDILRRAVEGRCLYMAIAVACRNPGLPVEVVEEYVTSERRISPYVRGDLLSNRNCPEGLLREYGVMRSESFHVEYRRGVAANPMCPADLQVLLAEDRRAEVRAALAGNPNLCPQALSILLREGQSSEVTAALVSRGLFPDRAVDEVLSSKRNVKAKRAIAKHVSKSEVLDRLSMDGDMLVREAVARNEAASDEAKVAVALLRRTR